MVEGYDGGRGGGQGLYAPAPSPPPNPPLLLSIEFKAFVCQTQEPKALVYIIKSHLKVKTTYIRNK